MGKIPMSILFMLTLTIGSRAHATIVEVDFHHNSIIQEGDSYYRVRVWHDAIVVMTGGEVEQFGLNDSSTATVIDGFVQWFELRDSSTASLYGGSFDILYAAGGDFHIYGYGFTIEKPSDLWTLTGFWPDGTPFEFRLRRAAPYGEHYVIHEVPEPAAVILLVLGSLCLRKNSPLHSIKGRI